MKQVYLKWRGQNGAESERKRKKKREKHSESEREKEKEIWESGVAGPMRGAIGLPKKASPIIRLMEPPILLWIYMTIFSEEEQKKPADIITPNNVLAWSLDFQI